MFFQRFVYPSVFFTLMTFGCFEPVMAQDYRLAEVEQGSGVIIERVEQDSASGGYLFDLLQDGQAQGRKVEHLEALRSFYLARDFSPYWVSRNRPNDNAEEMLGMLENAWTHGLNPYRYHLEDIRYLYNKGGDDQAMHALEVLLSDAYVSYGQDLSGIRVNPKSLNSDKRYWKAPFTADYLTGLLAAGKNIDDAVEVFTPQGHTYNQLRDLLVSLVQSEPEPYEAVLPIRIKGLLKPYEENYAVRDLRVRFDMDVESGSLVYDDQLAAKVVAFQKAHGLDADGVVGPATLDAINQTRMHRIYQIIANLERLRWVDEAKPDKFVIVNIPSAMLWAVEDGRVAFDMPVVVGREKRPTNIFIAEITGVRLNPTWTVPATIKKEDILPKLIADRNYLTDKGMELVYGRGGEALTLDPTAIDWTTVTEAELKTLRMIQMPGAHNPLGNVRVLMPNVYNIYLHDTNEKQYFDKPGRAASSGCVRMKRPMEMVEFILRGKPGWTDEKTQKTLAKGDLRDIYIPQTIPVYLVYYTAWVDPTGQIVFGNDLYGYDDEVIKMLSNLDEIFIPVDNTEVVGSISSRSRAQTSRHNL